MAKKLRTNILECAINTFRKKVRAETLGIQPVHRQGGFDASNRRREKILGRSSWYLGKSRSWQVRLKEKEEELKDKDQGPTS